jgi:hypothetical protein
MDNGLGPGILLDSDLMAMDYIYGIALHENDDRLARLPNVDIESALQAVVYHFNDLLHIITNVRAQIENDLEKGCISSYPVRTATAEGWFRGTLFAVLLFAARLRVSSVSGCRSSVWSCSQSEDPVLASDKARGRGPEMDDVPRSSPSLGEAGDQVDGDGHHEGAEEVGQQSVGQGDAA